MKTNQSQKDIPTGWQQVRLADFVDYFKGFPFKSEDYREFGTRVIRVSDLGKDFIHNNNMTFIDQSEASKYSKWSLKENDLIFTTVGSKPPQYDSLVGRVIKVGRSNIGNLLNQNTVLLRTKNQNNLNQHYVFNQFLTKKYISFIEGIIRGNANQGSITLEDLFEYTFILPSISEQSRIVSVIEVWDKIIEKLTQKIEAKKQIKKALMEDLLNGKKRLAGFKDKWVNIQIGEVFSFLRTYAVSRENLINDTSNDQGLGNIHYGDIHSTYGSSSIDLRKISVPQIKDTDFKFDKKDLLINGDLIMADVSEDYAGIGTTISIHELANKKILGGLHTFVFRDKSKMTTENYRQYIFQNEDIRNRLRKIANGVSVYGISKGNLSKMKLDLPSIQEQTIIANILTTADKEITELEKKLSIIKEQKRYLLNNLITGTIRTPETLSTKLTK